MYFLGCKKNDNKIIQSSRALQCTFTWNKHVQRKNKRFQSFSLFHLPFTTHQLQIYIEILVSTSNKYKSGIKLNIICINTTK